MLETSGQANDRETGTLIPENTHSEAIPSCKKCRTSAQASSGRTCQEGAAGIRRQRLPLPFSDLSTSEDEESVQDCIPCQRRLSGNGVVQRSFDHITVCSFIRRNGPQDMYTFADKIVNPPGPLTVLSRLRPTGFEMPTNSPGLADRRSYMSPRDPFYQDGARSRLYSLTRSRSPAPLPTLPEVGPYPVEPSRTAIQENPLYSSEPKEEMVSVERIFFAHSPQSPGPSLGALPYKSERFAAAFPRTFSFSRSRAEGGKCFHREDTWSAPSAIIDR
ncbi:unnamed protein product [Rangifer tarandus platyrhynchus]|uniref:Uncharacterized protein n=1 Tax=Rangifer tarandus platyrhynchus TaxID=3082113 RepID=A0ABN8XIE5_RANTA|nr:unnamed protein product [Rangifer tarandus platyrhynchus]